MVSIGSFLLAVVILGLFFWGFFNFMIDPTVRIVNGEIFDEYSEDFYKKIIDELYTYSDNSILLTLKRIEDSSYINRDSMNFWYIYEIYYNALLLEKEFRCIQ